MSLFLEIPTPKAGFSSETCGVCLNPWFSRLECIQELPHEVIQNSHSLSSPSKILFFASSEEGPRNMPFQQVSSCDCNVSSPHWERHLDGSSSLGCLPPLCPSLVSFLCEVICLHRLRTSRLFFPVRTGCVVLCLPE